MSSEKLINVAAEGIPYFTPAQEIPAGTALVPQPDGKPVPKVFQPLRIRGLEFQNRIWVRANASPCSGSNLPYVVCSSLPSANAPPRTVFPAHGILRIVSNMSMSGPRGALTLLQSVASSSAVRAWP